MTKHIRAVEKARAGVARFVPPFAILNATPRTCARVIDKDGFTVQWVAFNGNSKQRRQQKRALLKALNDQ